MNSNFEAQKTDMDSFSDIERKLYDLSVENGFDNELSISIAHSFTQYVLGYITVEGVAQLLVKSGAERKLAAELAEKFANVRGQAEVQSVQNGNGRSAKRDTIFS